MSDLVIFDTSVLVDELRTRRHSKKIESVEGLVRTSSVVLAELWRGVTDSAERKFLVSLARNSPILTPSEKNWIESGEILSRIRADHGLVPSRLRDLHFDVLIALTAGSHGARLITTNGTDFELIHSYRDFKLEVW